MARPIKTSIADREDLLHHWDFRRNTKEPSKVSVNEQDSYHWTDKCGHHWKQSPISLKKTSVSCYVCSGRVTLTGFNDLATLYPKLAKRWVYEQNEEVHPSRVSPRSNKKFYWWCEKGHAFKKSPYRMINSSEKCSVCTGKHFEVGVNDLGTRYPHLVPYWSEKNDNKIAESRVKGEHFFECSKGHLWKTLITPQLEKSFSCPYCSGYYIEVGVNDLSTTAPEVSKEWNYAKNYPLTPQDVKKFSHKKVWWTCSSCSRDFNLSICKRTGRGTGCPSCSRGRGISKNEIELYDFIKKICPEAEQANRTILEGYELDIFLPNLSKAIEFNGEYTHSNEVILRKKSKSAKSYHLFKIDRTIKKNIDLIFVWEHDWQVHKEETKMKILEWIHNNGRDPALERLDSINDEQVFCCLEKKNYLKKV